MPSPMWARACLNGVAAVAANDVWAVGYGNDGSQYADRALQRPVLLGHVTPTPATEQHRPAAHQHAAVPPQRNPGADADAGRPPRRRPCRRAPPHAAPPTQTPGAADARRPRPTPPARPSRRRARPCRAPRRAGPPPRPARSASATCTRPTTSTRRCSTWPATASISGYADGTFRPYNQHHARPDGQDRRARLRQAHRHAAGGRLHLRRRAAQLPFFGVDRDGGGATASSAATPAAGRASPATRSTAPTSGPTPT